MKTNVTTAEAQKIFVTSVALNTGPKGETGETGNTGMAGSDGIDGNQGLKGDPGDIPEAPINGKVYNRYNAGWIEAQDPTVLTNHNFLTGVSDANQHPIQAITGLQTELDSKEPAFQKNTGHNKDFGTIADTVTQGNDSRLSDARTPVAHGHLSQEVAVSVIGTPVHDNIQEIMDALFSTGLLHGGEITDGGTGTVNIAAGDAMIKAVNDVEGTLYSFDIVAQTGIVLTDNALNYLYIEYNAGTPQIAVTLTKRTDLNTNIFLGNVFREGTDVHINTARGYSISNPLSRLISRLQEVEPMEWASGASLSETGTLNIAVTAGAFWEGLNRLTTGAFDSSGADTFLYYYQDGASGWTEVVASAIVPEKYDDLSGTLATIGVNRYSVHWVYVGTDSDIYVLYGYGNHVVADAIADSAPSAVPPHIEAHGRLIGKIIVQESTSTFYSAESAFDVEFSVAAISSHLNLTAIGTNTHAQIDTFLTNAPASYNVITKGTSATVAKVDERPELYDATAVITLTIQAKTPGGYINGSTIALTAAVATNLTIALSGVTVRLPAGTSLALAGNNDIVYLTYISETVLIASGGLAAA